jgi:ABC-2 type transport system permease protein
MLFDFLLLVKAEIKRDYIYMKRYPLEILSFLFFMYMILLAILFGFHQLADGMSNVLNKEKMVLGYALMQFVLSTQMGWSGQIQNESQTGTLEQLSISGHSLGEVLLARGFAQLPRQILSFYLLTLAYNWSLQDLNMDLAHTIPEVTVLLVVLAIGIFGLSFVFAGITLIFKRVGFFFQIINFAFLGLFWQNRAALPDGSFIAFIYDHFPLTIGMSQLQSVLTSGESFRFSDLALFLLHSLAFSAFGFICFRAMEKRARTQGLLSQY